MIHPLAPTSPGLETIHRDHTRRRGWPDFAAFRADDYPLALRQKSARQWMRRAREEHGSILEFTQVAHALTGIGGPLEVLGSLARLITDEVRHAELCGVMAVTCWPEGPREEPDAFAWPARRAPWADAPRGDDEAVLRWAADAILTSCCIGETLSRPLFEAAATVTTDPVCEAVLRQILRDEHLHARFGWEAMATFRTLLSDDAWRAVEARLPSRLAAFERSCALGFTAKDVVGAEIVIEPGSPERPNLAMLGKEQYAMIFFATLDAEILPGFAALGFDAAKAWATRG